MIDEAPDDVVHVEAALPLGHDRIHHVGGRLAPAQRQRDEDRPVTNGNDIAITNQLYLAGLLPHKISPSIIMFYL